MTATTKQALTMESAIYWYEQFRSEGCGIIGAYVALEDCFKHKTLPSLSDLLAARCAE